MNVTLHSENELRQSRWFRLKLKRRDPSFTKAFSRNMNLHEAIICKKKLLQNVGKTEAVMNFDGFLFAACLKFQDVLTSKAKIS